MFFFSDLLLLKRKQAEDFVRNTLLLFLLGVILTGCGFHLRGMVDVPSWLKCVAVLNQGASRNIVNVLKKQLQTYHIHIEEEHPNKAPYQLIIDKDAFEQQIVTISSSTTPRQYQLFYRVWFHAQNAKGKCILPTNRIIVTRQVTINSDRILGSNFEEDLFKKEMVEDAATQILDRISKYSEL